MATLIQPSFSKGELSPALHGRVDTAAYQVGLRTARNAIVHAYGGVSNRAGSIIIGPVKNHTYAPRLIKFQFKATDTYQLEFGNLYMRVIREDGHVVETAQNITAITQANPAVVSIAAHGYTNGQEVFIDSVGGMTQLNGRRFIVAGVTAGTFQLTDQVTGANINSTGYGAYTSGGTAARIYEIITPYAIADVDRIKFTQSADVITLTHPSYAVRDLSRTGHTAWTLTEKTFEPGVDHPTGLGLTVNSAGATTFKYQVTVVDRETGEESLPGLHATSEAITAITRANPAVVTSAAHPYANGEEMEINGVGGMTELNGRRFRAANVTANTFELEGENSTTYGAYIAGGTANRTFVKTTASNAVPDNDVTWTNAGAGKKYNVYKSSNGIFGFIGEADGITFKDNNKAPDLDLTPPQARNPFRVAGDYPGAVAYHEQRLVLAGSTNKPDTTNYSKVAAFKNFTVSSPLQQDDAITATLTSREVNDIRHMVSGNDLLMFTGGAEWRITSGTDVAFAADTLRQKPQSNWGSSHNAPIVVGNTILYVTESKTNVRSIGYSLQIDGYTGSDLAILAGHLFSRYTIVDWAFCRSPDPIIYLVRSDGQMMCLTFQQEQEVVAWTHWDTLGKYERVSASRPNSTSIDEAPFYVVRRVVNGSVVRYIERGTNRRFSDVRDCFFVDSGISVDNPIAITGASLTNPVVITAPAHGLANGNTVDFFDIEWNPNFDEDDNETQPDQLNGRRFTVANVTANTFEVSGVDGTAYNAYISGGAVRKTFTAVPGLWHLEGRTVVALADGDVVKSLTVANGQVTIPFVCSRAHVGLKYIADVETLSLEVPNGTIQGKRTKIPHLTMRVDKTRGGLVGPDSDHLVVWKQRELELMGDPTSLLSGDTKIIIQSTWNKKGRVFIRQNDPLPITILAVIPEIDGED